VLFVKAKAKTPLVSSLKLANCQVCKGKVEVSLPMEECASCKGSGIHSHLMPDLPVQLVEEKVGPLCGARRTNFLTVAAQAIR
jgi:DnaJ-class molecular chaperone